MTRNPRTLTVLSALLVGTLLGTTGCGGSQAAGGGQDDESIIIGTIADLTGATGDVGTPYNEGIKGYVDWINAKGGIKGRKIQLLSDDYAYQVPKAEELYKKYVAAKAVAIQGWGTGDSEALRKKVAADELPFMSASYAEVLTDPKESPYNFVIAATYSDQMRIALKWIAEDAGGPAQVSVFHHDSPFGTAPLADGEAYVKEKGLNLGLKTYAMPKTSNFVGLLSQAKAQGAKYIVIQNVSSPAAQVAKDIKASGLDMKIVCLNWCSDELFVKTAGADAAKGHILVQPFAPPTAAKPGHAEIAEYLRGKGASLEDKGVHYVQGWYTMKIMAQGIEKALADGKELTGPNIKAALESLPAVDSGGVLAPAKFSAESHRGSTASGIYQVKDGKLAELLSTATP